MLHTFNSMFALFCPFIFFGLKREILATDRAIFVFISKFSGSAFVSDKTHQSRFWRKLKDFLFGATIYGTIKDLKEKRMVTEYGLMLVVFGDMLGYPLPLYYRFKLLPFWLPMFGAWKHYMLRERDITEKLGE